MTARWWAFGVWAVVAACAAYWGLRLFAPGRAVPTDAVVAPTGTSPRGDLARLLGADPVALATDAPPAPTNARFQLLGVVAPRNDPASREGVALIAVDGKPPRAYRVGAPIEGETVLQSVRARGASLGPRGGVVQVSLEIPPPPAAATGTLPAAGAAPGSPPPVAPAPAPAPPPGLPNLAPLPGTVAPRPPVVVPLPGRGPIPPSRSAATPPVDAPAPPTIGQPPVVQQVQ